MQVPPADVPADPSTIRAYDAVALLLARARAADPHFEVTPENAAAIAGITNRLDGLPLAIELGAGRLRAFTPQSLLDRLERPPAAADLRHERHHRPPPDAAGCDRLELRAAHC